MSQEARNLRDEIAEDYLRNARRMGDDPTWEDCQRIAAADLLLVDRANEAVPKAQDAEEKPEPQVSESYAEQLADEGKRVVYREPDDKPAVETLGSVVAEKRRAMLNRLRAIMTPVGVFSRNDPFGHCAFPRWAREAGNEHANWNLCRGPYAFVRTQAERDRIFYRKLEDVCDRSRRDLGPWWVK